jgi:hypothetical protein
LSVLKAGTNQFLEQVGFSLLPLAELKPRARVEAHVGSRILASVAPLNRALHPSLLAKYTRQFSIHIEISAFDTFVYESWRG